MAEYTDESRAKAVELLNAVESNLVRPTIELAQAWVDLYTADVRREWDLKLGDNR
jgi:hypothetical protein